MVIRERGPAWNWSVPMRAQADWEQHAAFMDALANEGVIAAGGPLGAEDSAARVLHIMNAPDAQAIEARLGEDPWTGSMLRTITIEPFTVLLGGFKEAP